MYDSRVGKFLSLDPRMADFAYMSPYVYAANSPLFYEDENGEGPYPYRFYDLLRKDSWYLTGFVAGIGDGVIETIDFAHQGMLLHPTNISPQAIKAKIEFYENSKMAFTVMSDKKLQDQIIKSIRNELGVFWDQTTMQGTNAEGGYQHGKIVFAVLETFIGVGEIKILVNTGKFSDNALQIIKKNKTQITKLLKPCGCFIAGTQVYTEDGYKNIEDIKVGDKVWAFDDTTGNLELKEVIDTFTREFKQIYKIYFGDEVLEVTQEHPFFIGGKWLKVDELKTGDLLTLYDGTTKAISKIELVEGNFKVYNFTVDKFHTYFVSKQNVLVHNGTPCDFGFAWQKSKTVLTDVLTKGIHGDIFYKNKKLTEIGFEISDDGELIYNIVGKKVSKEQEKIVKKAFEDKLKDPNFKNEIKEKAQEMLDSGAFKGKDREKKLQKIVDKL